MKEGRKKSLISLRGKEKGTWNGREGVQGFRLFK